MSEIKMKMVFNTSFYKQRWFEIPDKNLWSELKTDVDYGAFGRIVTIGLSNVPEDGMNAFLFGYYDRNFDWYFSRTPHHQKIHLRALQLWAADNGYELLFRNEAYHSTLFEQDPHLHCPSCGQCHPLSTFVGVNTDLYDSIIVCTTCASNMHTCNRCNHTYTGSYCTNCYTEEPCAVCGNTENGLSFVRRDVVTLPLCAEHFNIKLVHEHSYNWKPDFYIYRHMDKHKEVLTNKEKTGELYLGVEIEALVKHKYKSIYLTQLHELYGSLVIGKHDGTIESNIETHMTDVSCTELVVSPMTIDCYKNRTWKYIFDNVYKPESSFTGQLGGHIHMSMSAFINRVHLYKYMKFCRTNIAYLIFIGERDFSNNSYCKSIASTGKVTNQVINKKSNKDRYEILNITSFGTLENRFFVSPFTREHLFKNLEWCHALWEFTKLSPLHFTVKDFHAWVVTNATVYPNLFNFIKNSNNFVPNEELYSNWDDDDDEDYCEDSETHWCSDCGSEIYESDVIWVDDLAYCSDCAFYCSHCGEYHVGESHEVYACNTSYTSTWCNDCMVDHSLCCDHCGDTYSVYSTNHRIPVECYDDMYYCSNCRQDMNIDYCEVCNAYTPHDNNRCTHCPEQEEHNEPVTL